MSSITAINKTYDSPFHEGEQILQSRVGKREQMENAGRRAIRSFMPEQHRSFFEQLPFMVVGSVDDNGWPWASILSGYSGFISSPDENTLQIKARALTDDPLAAALKRPHSPLGLLGIELSSRRRNRLNGRVSKYNEQGFTLAVEQSFGNCPQYIQKRALTFVRDPKSVNATANTHCFTTLDQQAVDMINAADTFFVSSCVHGKKNAAVDGSDERKDVEGVDVSHRGGRAGFVNVSGNTLTVPDYPGNSFFNTLGNFLINPKGGLIFIDFESGDVLMLTGTVELLWERNKEIQAFKGAERAWTFTVVNGIRLKNALAFRSPAFEYSPNSLLTGHWADAHAIVTDQQQRNTWRQYQVIKRQMESSTICSFYLQPAKKRALLPFEAGQHLTVRITLENSNKTLLGTYTVSSAPGENYYRISVKKEPKGLLSSYFHEHLNIGDIIECKAPQGDFFIDTIVKRPAVLIAGGVGITPMIAMAKHALNQGILTRHLRPLTIVHSASVTTQRAFSKEFHTLEDNSNGAIRYVSFISQPQTHEKAGVNFQYAGRITAELLKQSLVLNGDSGVFKKDADFYLCGPNRFMQSMYNILVELGVANRYIFAEAFGPSALKRSEQEISKESLFIVEEAESAVIKFTESNIEVPWSLNHTLLSLAEQHGLSPSFSCRQGSCGSCAVKFRNGRVVYKKQPTAQVANGEVLICCAVPAKGTTDIDIEL